MIIRYDLSVKRDPCAVVLSDKSSVIIKIKHIVYSKIYISFSVINKNIQFHVLDKIPLILIHDYLVSTISLCPNKIVSIQIVL